MIALITPSGGRPDQIKLCERWMQAQTYTGEITWILIDDCEDRTITDIERQGWDLIKIYPEPKWQFGQNTQARNISEGIKICKELQPDAIFIIEDDDYYKPVYLDEMMKRMGNFQIIGELNTIYYNVYFKRWVVNGNDKWSSLFQTAFTPDVIPLFEQCYSEQFIDFVFFRLESRINLFHANNLSVGIKGMNGRYGIGAGHGNQMNMESDPNFKKLFELIGPDAEYYRDMCFV
jgi:hypothetical protein